jgi:hypothetical protein
MQIIMIQGKGHVGPTGRSPLHRQQISEFAVETL